MLLVVAFIDVPCAVSHPCLYDLFANVVIFHFFFLVRAMVWLSYCLI
jgi:hypothetical protein